MTIRETILQQPVPPSGLLSTDFDSALLGWASRADVSPTVAYSFASLVPTAVRLWEEMATVDFLNEQWHAPAPEVVMVEGLPAVADFWKLVGEGLLIWEHLNPAIVGIAHVRGELCAVYHADYTLQLLSEIIDQSDTDNVLPAVQEFFDRNLRDARLGPRTPLLLYGAATPPRNNGLGPDRPKARNLPVETPEET